MDKYEKIELDLDNEIIINMNENIKNETNNIFENEADLEKNKNENIKLIKEIIFLLINEQDLYDVPEKIYLSIQSVSAEEIQQINKEYRNVDKVTDVLSFPIFEREEIIDITNEKLDSKKIKEIELGDIIICIDVVKKQALEFETGIKREMLYMITHGVCHLLGFDHIDENDKVEMRALEEKILNKVGVKR